MVKLTMEPVTRIEGHAKITVHLDEAVFLRGKNSCGPVFHEWNTVPYPDSSNTGSAYYSGIRPASQ